MIPSAFVELDRIPLTTSGKVDRRALPTPEASAATSGYIAPRTPAEQAIAAIWADVLGVEQVGIHDNFFELGGDSILSMRTTARLRSVFGVQLSPRATFEHPTVASLAGDLPPLPGPLGEGSPKPADDIIPVLPRDSALPLSFAQQRLWFLDQFEPGGA
jgi:acyl carrier protein